MTDQVYFALSLISLGVLPLSGLLVHVIKRKGELKTAWDAIIFIAFLATAACTIFGTFPLLIGYFTSVVTVPTWDSAEFGAQIRSIIVALAQIGACIWPFRTWSHVRQQRAKAWLIARSMAGLPKDAR